jgi:hypothetical protein
LVVSPRPKREWWAACSKPNEPSPSQKRRRSGYCAQKCRPDQPDWVRSSHEWAPLQAACGEAAKASNAASLRVGPCRCSYRRLTQRVLCESAAGRTGSCSAGYAALIAFVRDTSTSKKFEGILTEWLPSKAPSALTDGRRMLRFGPLRIVGDCAKARVSGQPIDQ